MTVHDLEFSNFPDAFDFCRECDKPVTVIINGERWKLFPSGSAELLDYDINSWPYPTLSVMWKNGDHSWREVTEDIYWDQLEVVPPARMKGGAFMVGEPWNHDERGAIHAAYALVGGRYFCRYDHLIDFHPALYRRQIVKQFGLEV